MRPQAQQQTEAATVERGTYALGGCDTLSPPLMLSIPGAYATAGGTEGWFSFATAAAFAEEVQCVRVTLHNDGVIQRAGPVMSADVLTLLSNAPLAGDSPLAATMNPPTPASATSLSVAGCRGGVKGGGKLLGITTVKPGSVKKGTILKDAPLTFGHKIKSSGMQELLSYATRC